MHPYRDSTSNQEKVLHTKKGNPRDEVDFFDEDVSDVAAVQVVGGAVESAPVGVAETVRADLGKSGWAP